MSAAPTMATTSQLTHDGVLTVVAVSVCCVVWESLAVAIESSACAVSSISACASSSCCHALSVADVVCLTVCTVRVGYCRPVLSGWLQSVTTTSSLQSVVACRRATVCTCAVLSVWRCAPVWLTICVCVRFVCSVSIVVCTVLQLTLNRTISSMRALRNFVDCTVEAAHIFS